MKNGGFGMFRSARYLISLLLVLPLLAVLGTASAQSGGGKLEQIHVFGPSLEGNLEGDDPNREVFVYLPPSYASSPNRRYPTVYFLHGYSVGADRYVEMTGMPGAADEAIANGVREMIIVMPDGNSIYNGSMYSNSPTTGDWESYIADDLVGYIDAHYRTVAERGSRGLSGHSMGGYGTVRIGMKRPEVFGAIYAMSACCLMNQAPSQEAVEQDMARAANGPPDGSGFANARFAQAAAWAPDPANPPYYIDWPYKDGELQPIVAAKWLANSPLVMIDQYLPSMKSFSGIFIDVGDQDSLMATNKQLSESLDRLGVAHGFEIYEGNHVNRVGQRFRENVLPFFSEHLD